MMMRILRPLLRAVSPAPHAGRALPRRAVFLGAALLAGGSLAAASPAWADRPWQNALRPAHILSDRPLSATLRPALTATADGVLFALDERNALARLDPQSGQVQTFPDLPPLDALTADRRGVWAVTKSPTPHLLHLAPDGSVLSDVALTTRPPAARPSGGGHIAALQVHGRQAYLADDVTPAVIVAEVSSGKAEYFLENDPSLSGYRPLIRGGKPVPAADGRPKTGGNIAFMALDSTGSWLFYQPPAGPLYRIGTSLLTDPDVTAVEQLGGIVNWRDTPSLGGLALSGDGTFYLADIADGSLLKFGADRLPFRLLNDPVLSGAEGLALLPRDGQGRSIVAALIGANSSRDGKMHILRIALP